MHFLDIFQNCGYFKTSVMEFRKNQGYRHFFRQTLALTEVIFIPTYNISRNRTVHLDIDINKHQMSLDI